MRDGSDLSAGLSSARRATRDALGEALAERRARFIDCDIARVRLEMILMTGNTLGSCRSAGDSVEDARSLPLLALKLVPVDIQRQRPRGEALRADSPPWDMPRVLITPHNSAVSSGNDDRAVEIFLSNFTRWHAGQPMTNHVTTIA